jgi:hypothetical protein
VRPFFVVLPLMLAAAAQAQPPVPMCIPQREGMVACFEGRLCLCRFQPGGQLTGRPDGHRWDCGPLRPDCRPPGATLDPGPYAQPPWPPGLPPPQIFLSPGQMTPTPR